MNYRDNRGTGIRSGTIAAGKFPDATQIVDLYHAREHLHDLARHLEFMLPDRGRNG